MLKLVNALLAAGCFVILGSDVLAATHELELTHSFDARSRDKIGLREAVSIAEDRADGRAVDANLTRFAGVDSWNVDVLSNGRHVHVSIDARNGTVDVARSLPQGAR
ncbi:MAG: hypothetical protein GC190_03140 [Alphaproteobacteria bacterium]|nr:hypothetical protein [Alphaproteobacteria bacterium]